MVDEKGKNVLRVLFKWSKGADFEISMMPQGFHEQFGYKNRASFGASFPSFGEKYGVLKRRRQPNGKNIFVWTENAQAILEDGAREDTPAPQRQPVSKITNSKNKLFERKKSRVSKDLMIDEVPDMSGDVRLAFDLLGEEITTNTAEHQKYRVSKSFFDVIEEDVAESLIGMKLLIPCGPGNSFNGHVWKADTAVYKKITKALRAREAFLEECGFGKVRKLDKDELSKASYDKLMVLSWYIVRVLEFAKHNQEIIEEALDDRSRAETEAARKFFADVKKKMTPSLIAAIKRDPGIIEGLF